MKVGDDYKDKLREIAEKQNRDMTGQVRHWIDRFHEDDNE